MRQKLPKKQQHKSVYKKPFFIGSVSIVVIAVLILLVVPFFQSSEGSQPVTETIAVKSVDSQILATGTIESVNQADLHFQTGGKLTSLPVKEGDTVKTGQLIARLDSYALEQQLRQAYNTYQSSQDSYNQSVEGQKSGVTENQTRKSLDTNSTNMIYSAVPEADVIYDTITRAIDQNKNNMSSAAISVELANYAIQLASITAPFDGIVTHEDVTSSGVNVTPVTTFSIADPNNTVFRANVAESDVSFISVGSQAEISLQGTKKPLIGEVSKIYPQKITLASGETVYQVDITSTDLKQYGNLKQTGSVLIANKFSRPVILLPAWTVLNKQYVWIMRNNTPQLISVTTGNIVGDDIEITSGILPSDRVIVNPKSVIAKQYTLL